jgi:hypothetical protein
VEEDREQRRGTDEPAVVGVCRHSSSAAGGGTWRQGSCAALGRAGAAWLQRKLGHRRAAERRLQAKLAAAAAAVKHASAVSEWR